MVVVDATVPRVMAGRVMQVVRQVGVPVQGGRPADALRFALPSVLGALLLGASACSTGAANDGGQAGSCASEITIAGVTYIAGHEGEGTTAVPHTGTVLHGTTPPCADTRGEGSTVPARPAIAYTIPSVHVADAVAGPRGYEVMVAERLWQQPWTQLPPELQPYVGR